MNVSQHSPLDSDERHAFVEEATAFLEANAQRRPRSTEAFVWGRGSGEVSLMGGRKKEDEDEKLALARAWRAKVYDAGFGWLGGPKEYGGAGRHPELDHVYRSLEGEFVVPDQSMGCGVGDGGASSARARRGPQASIPAACSQRTSVLAAAQ
jgi:acyl-CoA dehydrogenase